MGDAWQQLKCRGWGATGWVIGEAWSFGGEATIQSTSWVWVDAARVGFAVLSKGGTCACFRGLHLKWVPGTTPPDNSRSDPKVNNDDASSCPYLFVGDAEMSSCIMA